MYVRRTGHKFTGLPKYIFRQSLGLAAIVIIRRRGIFSSLFLDLLFLLVMTEQGQSVSQSAQ